MMITTVAVLATLFSPAQGGGPEKFEQKIPGSAVSFRMIKIPAGTVSVGGKQVAVKPIWVGETELTWDVYDIFAFRMDMTREQQAQGVDATSRPSKPYGAPDRGFGHAGFPALGMTDNSAARFCEWLSKKTGKKYRLMTEAEWQYAAEAGSKAAPGDVEEFAWCWDNSDDQTHKTATKKPNAWGFYDMLGNAWEWTIGVDGKPVVCGGSYVEKKADIGFGARKHYSPSWQEADAHVPKSKWWLSDGPFIGMRVACEP